MLEIDYRRYGVLRAKLTYFADYLPPTAGYHLVSCNNCYTELPNYHPYKQEQRQTVLIDLLKDTDKIFSNINRKRRNDIRRGLKIGFQFVSQEANLKFLKEFRHLYNKFVVPKGAAALLDLETLLALSPYLTAFAGKYADQTLIMMLIIHDGRMARVLLGARNEASPYTHEGYFIQSNLQWELISHFKARGYHAFDLGGINLDPNSPAYGITRNKLSFGGEVVPTYYYEAVVTPLARLMIRGGKLVKSVLAHSRAGLKPFRPER